jgi:hypothetical protein
MVNVPPTHVTDAEIEQFHRRQLTPEVLLPLTDHLADCDDCRRRVAKGGDQATASALLRKALGIDLDEHVSELDIQAVAGGTLSGDRRDEVTAHLDQCRACAEEVRDLQAFIARSTPAGGRRWRWTAGALAAAAVLIVGIALGWLSRSNGARPVASLVDASGVVTLDSRGSLAGVDALGDSDRERVRQAIHTGRLSLPSTLSALNDRGGALLGPADAPPFRVVAPLGMVVLDTQPTLRWTPLAGAAAYIVTLQEQTTGHTISSSPLTRDQWVVDHPLTRGATYTWQVAGSVQGGAEMVAPRPPAPAARFRVLDAQAASQLQTLPASHLVRGILYANAGLVADAERELAALSAQNPDSEIASTLLRQIRTIGGDR